MTDDDRRNPDTVGFFTAALHYAAFQRAKRAGKPIPSAQEVENMAKYVMHADAQTNTLWYRLLESLFSYEERQAELQKRISDAILQWSPLVAVQPPPISPEEWQEGVSAAERRMLHNVGVPADMFNGTPRYGPSPLLPALRQFEMIKRFRQSGKTETITKLPVNKNGDVYNREDKPVIVVEVAESDTPVTVMQTGAYEFQGTEFNAGSMEIKGDGSVVITAPDVDDHQPFTIIDKPQ